MEQEVDFRVLFETTPGLYLALSPDLTIIAVNNAYASATMTKRHEIVGRYLFEVFPDNPADLAADGVSNLHASLNSVLKNKTAHTMAVQKYDIRRPDGTFEERFWSPLNTPVLNAKNEVIYIIHRVEDVTDYIRLQKEHTEKDKMALELEKKVRERTIELTNSLQRERAMNEMKSRFVSMASHEFRTPLATILSSLALLEHYKDPGQEENKLKHINRINSSVKNLTAILNDFLSLSQLEKGGVEAEKEEIHLPAFLRTVVEEMEGMVNQKKQKIVYKHSGEDTIENSKKILRNVLLNLLSNASKYSTEGKEIFLTSNVNNGSVSITVKDSGMGIPEDEQKNLFTEFFRARNVENIQGTGLGLNIVKKYLELLNGTIHFTSKLNKGTTFIITFPRHSIIPKKA